MNKFRFAIMGAGNIAGKFADAVSLLDNCEVAAVSSKSMNRAKNFAEKCGINAFYDTYEKMLQEVKPDGVYIATTPDSHYALTKLCMQYHVPVLCEKAMFMNSKDARDIFEDSKKNQVFVMEAMWSRFLPAVNKAKQWMKEGIIGEVNCLSMNCGCSFDREISKRNFDPKLGGGAAFDLTVYNYELATWFFGDEIKDMKVVSLWEENGIDSFNHVTLKYEDKLAVLLSSCVTTMREELVMSGTEGKIIVPHAHFGNEVYAYDKAGNEILHYVDEETQNGFVYEIQEVVNCIGHGEIESKVVPHELTIRCAELFDEIYRQNHKMKI